MGSFDGVCGLSRMALGPGDPVVAMMIRNNPWRSYPTSPIYPFDVWQPVTVLSRGEYADYGNVDLNYDAWGLTTEAAKTWWKRVWYPASMTESGHDIPASWRMAACKLDDTFDPSGKRPDYRNSRVDETDDGTAPMYSIWMAHAGIFDHLADTVRMEYVYGEGKHWSIRQHAMDAFEKGDRQMNGEIPDRYKDVFNAIDNTEEAKLLVRRLRFTADPWKPGGSMDSSPVADYLSEAIYDAFDAGVMPLYESLAAHWRNSFMMLHLMMQMRISLAPPGTIGPQHGHDQPHLMLADAIRDQAAKNKIKYEEDWEDEGDGPEAAA